MNLEVSNLPTLGQFRATLPDVDGERLFPARGIPGEVRFALIWNPHYKPVAFPTLRELALSIERRRRGAAIHLFSTRVPMMRDDRFIRVVKVTALHEGAPRRLIGCAWLGGDRDGQRQLRLALHEVGPVKWRVA